MRRMILSAILAGAAMVLCGSETPAQSRRGCPGGQCGAVVRPAVAASHPPLSLVIREAPAEEESDETQPVGTSALMEVNAARAARGLPAFIYDLGLSRAAGGCAVWRAERLIAGHTANDFQALPPGSTASAAGCSAVTPEWGFQSCCLYERWTYAGAAKVMGRDGKMYCHLFVH